jgi:hypothetical protein
MKSSKQIRSEVNGKSGQEVAKHGFGKTDVRYWHDTIFKPEDRDAMRLANFQRVRGFDAEWKFLRRPAKHCLPNLTPLWAKGNFGANSSNVVSSGIYKRDVNVAVCFHFCSDGSLASV